VITPGFWASEGGGYSPLFEPPPVGNRTESLGQNGVRNQVVPIPRGITRRLNRRAIVQLRADYQGARLDPVNSL